MGHVNNAVYATYFEEARAAFCRDVLGIAAVNEFDFVVARMEVDYRRPLRYGEPLTASVALSKIGRSSFTLRYRLATGDETVAEGETVQVFYDYASGKSKPMPESFLKKAEPYFAPEGA